MCDAINKIMYKGRFCTSGGIKAPLGYVETDPSGRYGRVSSLIIYLLVGFRSNIEFLKKNIYYILLFDMLCKKVIVLFRNGLVVFSASINVFNRISMAYK